MPRGSEAGSTGATQREGVMGLASSSTSSSSSWHHRSRPPAVRPDRPQPGHLAGPKRDDQRPWTRMILPALVTASIQVQQAIAIPCHHSVLRLDTRASGSDTAAYLNARTKHNYE